MPKSMCDIIDCSDCAVLEACEKHNIRDKGVVQLEWELELENNRAHFYGAQYSLLAIAESNLDIDKLTRIHWHGKA